MNCDELSTIESIKRLKYRYVRAIDTHDWNLMESCFTTDAVFEPDSGAYVKQGRTEIVSFFMDLVGPGFVSSHTVSHPEIDLVSPVQARGRWRLDDIVHFVEDNQKVGSGPISAGSTLRGASYYYDEYRVEESSGEWKISYLTFVRIFKSVSVDSASEITVDERFGIGSWPAVDG